MTDNAASSDGPLVTGAEIARLAGVTRAAVSNWRRRHEDFPAPAGGAANSPLYALADVQEWLDRQRKGQEVAPEVELWQAMRAAYGEQMVVGLAEVAAVLAGEPESSLPDDVATRVQGLAQSGAPVDLVSGLTERFMDSARRAGSDQVTGERVVRAVCHFAPELPAGATVFDPACGIGVLLLSVAAEAGMRCRGQEVEADSARFAQLRADLLGRSGVRIVAGDSLRADEWPDLKADLVVCDPPAGVTEWGREELLLDSRWELGTPSKAEGELAWLQHAYAHTLPGGQVLMVMPASVAYRKAGRRIRAELVRRGIVRQVVALPPGTATSHALPVHLWCLRRPENAAGADTNHTVCMVDLTGNSPDGSLEPRPDQIADVPLIELLDDTVDLTPGSHLRSRHRDYPGEYAALRKEIEDRIRRLAALLPELAPGGGPGSLDGATTSVAELARAGLVAYDGPEPVSASEQLDTDYLQGFLRSSVNTRRSTSASGTYRFDSRGSRIPRMGIEEQRRYGSAFRALSAFEEGMREVDELTRQLAEVARDGLATGALAPEE
ncbi:N-6 DNA methylase [Streptomyces viridochromogenes]|uniref:N-6 DNA methylase n=1 Tax=Streptomyces viridochromogenes TaxID=1938 RepID=A0A0J7YXT5_STRVR|nr:N-6 DNA methylase [Streptomyces viridochromogenes]KMS68262.1 N-6 DNA methylase [Streptomyces viridochromogenes]KOG08791.1 N-6 DNA methylase [Streptomyces viridochromogenes]KOG09133.1 N-6 DNA methylase [Streptomyces viridochromogenes]